MSKHYFHESKGVGSNPQFYRIIYCEWCGLVVWDFNSVAKRELQAKVGKPCVHQPKQEGGGDE